MGDVRCTSESVFFTIGAQQNNGGFLTDTFGISPDITVEHYVAEHQNSRRAKRVQCFNQLIRHLCILAMLSNVWNRQFLPHDRWRSDLGQWQSGGDGGSDEESLAGVSIICRFYSRIPGSDSIA